MLKKFLKLFKKSEPQLVFTIKDLHFFHEKFLRDQERYQQMAKVIGTVTAQQIAVLHAAECSMNFSHGGFSKPRIGELVGLGYHQVIKKLKIDYSKVAEIEKYFKI
jgi:hypothetical protein